ncbi:MAG TPA: hypothetical protein ENI87_13585 [bacterium]|nr:hypothetical protein [bacterium]
MRRRRVGAFLSAAWLAATPGCVGGPEPLSTRELLATADPSAPPRLVLDDDRVIATACPIVPAELPPPVCTTLAAIAPDGELAFVAREHGPRGDGFRVEKRYDEPVPHVRSLLIDANGTVLERAHTLPLPRVPKPVLATALRHGQTVERAAIVSGPLVAEHWSLLVSNRHGRQFVVTVGLDGTPLGVRRRHRCVVDS